MSWLTVLGWARKVPALAYAWAAIVAAVVAFAAWHQHRLDTQRAAWFEEGRQAVLVAARVDTVLAGVVAAHTAALRAKTDTVVRVVTRQVRRVDSIVVADTIRERFPVVDTLVVESQALVRAVDSLTVAIAQERAASALLVATVRASEQQARLAVVREHDQVVALSRRPRWSRVVVGSVALAAVGYVAGGSR